VANGFAYASAWNYEGGTSAPARLPDGLVPGPGRLRRQLANRPPGDRVRGRHRLSSIAGDDGGVRAFDGATGQQRWYSHLLGIGNGTEDAGNVAATDGAVCFSMYANAAYGRDNALLSLDARTDAVRRRVAAAGASSPAVATRLVLAGLAQGIGAWRLSDGVRRWRYGSAVYGAPVVSGGRLYVGATTRVGGQPVALHDQFSLGAAAPGVIR
jgi:outer membrane protein assembly factor BamB